MRNKRKSICAKVIIRNEKWKKITKETNKIITKITYRWNNQMTFRKWITRGEFVHFRSTIDTGRSRTRRIQLIIFNYVHYFKLPYIGYLSHHIKNKLLKLCKEFCKENFNIKLVFSSFKIKNYFSYKDLIPNDLKSFLVYKLVCASCSSSNIGETCRHFKTRIEDHIRKDNKSHIFKHLNSTATCFDSYNSLCFAIIDKGNSKFDIKIKKLYILTEENLT